jgi:hypothetical protein
MLAALLNAHLHQVCGALALQALETSAIAPPWLHQDPTTISL